MEITVKRKNKIILFLSILFFYSACASDSQWLERRLLFSLPIGKMENQLNFWIQPDSAAFLKNDFFYRNGLFTLCDSRQNKILVLSTKGDLLSLYYQPNQNPKPITLFPQSGGKAAVSNLNAYPHSFLNIRNVIADSDRRLMVDDAVEPGRVEIDKASKAVLNRIIRRIGPDGSVIDDLGQEGVGGSPFPFIEKLQVSKGNQLTVICRTQDQWQVYSYSEAGACLFSLSFTESQLPTVFENRFAALEAISVDAENRELFLKINFYEVKSYGDGNRGGPVFADSSVWVYDLKQHNYRSHFDLPKKMVFDPALKSKREVLYQFLGADKKNHLFYLAPNDAQTHEVLVMHPNGKVFNRFRIKIEDPLGYDKYYHLSPEGILSALIVCEDRVDVVQWRTDRMTRREGAP